MLINRDHRAWIVGTVVATAGLAAAYALYVADRPVGASGGSWPGLRVRHPRHRRAWCSPGCCRRARGCAPGGSAAPRRWMRMHIWLGLLAVPCIWFHSGFALGGALTTALMWLFYIVIVSGIVGLVAAAVRAGRHDPARAAGDDPRPDRPRRRGPGGRRLRAGGEHRRADRARRADEQQRLAAEAAQPAGQLEGGAAPAGRPTRRCPERTS